MRSGSKSDSKECSCRPLSHEEPSPLDPYSVISCPVHHEGIWEKTLYKQEKTVLFECLSPTPHESKAYLLSYFICECLGKDFKESGGIVKDILSDSSKSNESLLIKDPGKDSLCRYLLIVGWLGVIQEGSLPRDKCMWFNLFVDKIFIHGKTDSKCIATVVWLLETSFGEILASRNYPMESECGFINWMKRFYSQWKEFLHSENDPAKLRKTWQQCIEARDEVPIDRLLPVEILRRHQKRW